MSCTTDVALWPTAVSAGTTVYPPGGRFGPRIQLTLQFVMLHSGNMTVWIDGQPRYADANTVCVLFPHHEEEFVFAEDEATAHSWLHISIHELPTTLQERLERVPWPLRLSPTIAALTREALAVRNSALSTSEALLKSIAVQLIWRYIGEGELQLQGHLGMMPHPAVTQAQEFIHMHFAETLVLRQIAEAASISPAQLIRLFRAQLNTTPIAYLWSHRVAMGIELLEQTGLPVGLIADRCGFQTSYHFSRRIHAATGLTPLEVRRRVMLTRRR